MSVTTKTYREKANQTEFVAVVRYYVEVAPGERYDVHFQWGSGDDTVSVYARDDSDIETFPSQRAAEKWVRNRLKAQLTKGTHIAGAEVTEYFYKVVTTHDDPEYGDILDAEDVAQRRWHYTPDGRLDDLELLDREG